jgi:hypothetical protein
MKTREIIKISRRLAEPFRVSKGKSFASKMSIRTTHLNLKDEDGLEPRKRRRLAAALVDLQDKLTPRTNGRAVDLQAMDAARTAPLQRNVGRKSTGLSGVFI